MTVTTTTLTRGAGACAVVAGLLFVAVQIKHPQLDAAFVTTTEYTVREGAKFLMAVLALAGITGMYLRQVKQTGVLGLAGYLLFSLGYLLIMSTQVIAAVVLPTVAASAPGYVTDVLAGATNGKPVGDIGLMVPFGAATGVGYLGGGLLFGIALFRAGILARWAAALLAAGTVASAAIPLLPQVNQRLFAVPTGIALIGLGYSLWRDQRDRPATATATDRPVAAPGPQLDPAGTR